MADSGEASWVVRELPDPVDAGAAARAISQLSTAWCWFDGAAPPPGEPAVSYIGVASEVRTATRGSEPEFLEELRRARRAGHAPQCNARGGCSAGCFFGGWVMALSYEFGSALIGVDPAPDGAVPAFALRIDVVLAIDHMTGRAELRGPSDAELDDWMRHFGGAVRPSTSPEVLAADPILGCTARWRKPEHEYLASIEACRAAIRDGDAYVLCLTDTAEAHTDADPLELFTRLRQFGPAARGAVLVTEDRALVSMSPERFLSVHSEHSGDAYTVATHPIKGTRRRGETPSEDHALAARLAADPKERAENLMIVDLMRNDLSRVCDLGTVAVEGFLRVETHPHVHQLVSTVTGRIRGGMDVFDAIRSCFPGGSMTGAPKRRAVEILARLEHTPRGLYAGCFGWVSDGGSAEIAMTIRGVELRHENADRNGFGARGGDGLSSARVGAGAGLTADSEPGRELRETRLKAGPLLAALKVPNES
ncbi:MAG: anthranilate synthase component I family protein [Leucobacter sp.]